MAELKFEITEHFGVLSESAKGWSKEINLVSWNDREPKYDIREWDPEHEKMSKGITMNRDEMIKLRDCLNEMKLSDN
ncbi:MAG: PC4/YdbC family ssDNA-binding protein [Eubacteriales bacterium]|nr:PC4/YdbC family ssDNA-binding protein [Eubacteriales bacterium]